MNKNYLLEAFSAVCDHIADNMADLLIPNLTADQEMITPIFENAHLSDLAAWWEMDDHFAKYIAQMEELVQDDPNSREENINDGIAQLAENPELYGQLQALAGESDDLSNMVAVIKHLPHVAEYALDFKKTKGFEKLDAVCETMDNVIVWPMVTVDPDATDLKKAFYLNVAILSTDGTALKPKIKTLAGIPKRLC